MKLHRTPALATLAALLASACSAPPRPAPAPAPPPTAAAPAAPAAAPAADATPIPLDPQIRRTVLPNGLTVYVKRHAKPEQRASLWLAVDAGSVHEDDDQRGLAHFVEHMAFNGTRRFAKQAIIDYIEKVGMQFGPDVNAFTSFDETAYQLTVPTDDDAILTRGLDILRDWAGDVSFDAAEIEKERGVVLEEWRSGRGAFERIADKEHLVTFADSRYAARLPIGLPDIIRKAPREALARFYRDWYRPEHMAVIAVGDFDPDRLQREIAARFGDLPAPGPARARTPAPVPRDHPTAVSIATDPEMPYSVVSVLDKLPRRPAQTRADYRRALVEALYHRMLRERFDELARDPAAPFTIAGSLTTDLARTAEGFSRRAIAKQGRTADALAALFREIERVERHGFLETELGRARADELAEAETAAAEWDKTPSEELADELSRHFLERRQVPGRPAELALTRALLPGIALAELNHLARSLTGERGRVIALAGPASVKLPTEAEVRAIADRAATAAVEPWREAPPRPLLARAPAPGTITATSRDEAAGATVWRLSNGVRVIAKPTAFQNDAVEIAGWQPGGSSLIDDPILARFAADVVASGGAGELDATGLSRALAGKVAAADVALSERAEEVYGAARPADLEAALQLLHVKLTAPRRDERAFAAWQAEQTEWARNRRLDPEEAFFDDMEALRTGDHPRRRPATPELIAKVDLDRAHAAWRQRFADLGGFTFVIVGNVDLAKLAPLVETYLGSLPSAGGRHAWRDIGIKYPAGKLARAFTAGSEPKSSVDMSFGAPDRWSRDGERDASILTRVLDIRLREVLREDLGGVYGSDVWVTLSREPTSRRAAQVTFTCDPANAARLQQAVLGVVRELQQGGIGPAYLEKVKEQLRRGRETDAQENLWWIRQLRAAAWYGEDVAAVTDLSGTLARVTSDHVRAAARRFFDERHSVTGVLSPAGPRSP